ncbi:hypothetical protein AAFF_G00330430 [Aldrovandia affinis]|uniref:Uncharacterized protein n=1 Tax=Aldrovandia affinis TaxID=143900 RepID=A0AAD7SLZ3_9TELE|nr:hypothetical protein AAFF_G00330430 [Aldrovandia affinis]
MPARCRRSEQSIMGTVAERLPGSVALDKTRIETGSCGEDAVDRAGGGGYGGGWRIESIAELKTDNALQGRCALQRSAPIEKGGKDRVAPGTAPKHRLPG